MKRKIFRYLVVFICLFLAMYYIPILNGAAKPTPKKSATPAVVQKYPEQLTKPQNEVIKTSGLAAYIGQDKQQIQEKFGQPERKDETLNQIEWWVYHQAEDAYFQIGFNQLNQKVSRIFAIGKGKHVAPFYAGMSLESLTNLTSLSANFEAEVHEQLFQIELSEDDLTEKPLIAFKNNSFAILSLNDYNQVNAIEYLDSESLLKMNLYKVISMTPIPVEAFESRKVEKVADAQRNTILDIVNFKRVQQQQVKLTFDKELTKQAQEVGQVLNETPEMIFGTDKRLAKFNDLRIEALNNNLQLKPFTLTETEVSKLQTKTKTQKNGLYYLLPYQDNLRLLLLKMDRERLIEPLLATDVKKIGLSIDKRQVILLIANN